MPDDEKPDDQTPDDQTSPWSNPAQQGGTPAPPPGQPEYNQPQYGQPQYGQQQYGQQPGPYGAAPGYGPSYGAPPRSPESERARSSATLWLILNIVSVLFCGNLPGIVGAIYAGVALGNAGHDPGTASRQVRTSKIWFFLGLILGLVLLIVGIIILVVAGYNSDGSSGPYALAG